MVLPSGDHRRRVQKAGQVGQLGGLTLVHIGDVELELARVGCVGEECQAAAVRRPRQVSLHGGGISCADVPGGAAPPNHPSGIVCGLKILHPYRAAFHVGDRVGVGRDHDLAERVHRGERVEDGVNLGRALPERHRGNENQGEQNEDPSGGSCSQALHKHGPTYQMHTPVVALASRRRALLTCAMVPRAELPARRRRYSVFRVHASMAALNSSRWPAKK